MPTNPNTPSSHVTESYIIGPNNQFIEDQSRSFFRRLEPNGSVLTTKTPSLATREGEREREIVPISYIFTSKKLRIENPVNYQRAR